MSPNVIAIGYQVCFIIIPTISAVGGAFVVYVTIRSKHKDHRIRQDICCYLQLVPLFGFCLSVTLLLGVAADRLMSFSKY
ncbi:hypothetical protein GCK32_011455 [Trichostrongylus colubriformis]|uniref:Uncharacterized protein n=1 Tax=Trichostrongylus colubriformis TaxID=6319 RepID=A0AAN8FZ07_TRICO